MSPHWHPTLTGRLVSLRPLAADDHEKLYQAASDPGIWEQHPEPTRWQRNVFQRFFDSAIALNAAGTGGSMLVQDAATHAVIGSSRWYDWNADAREVVIGYTFLARSHWGGQYNRELKALMLRHAFQYAQRVWFHVGPSNLRSQAALKRIGARYSHTVGASPASPLETLCFVMDAAQFATVPVSASL